MAKDRIVLVDGSALIFRAFFAIPSTFQSSQGVPTNATYGFALMFRKILAGKTPAKGAVIFDAPGKTFRDAKYPKYKAHRPRMPAELRTQIPWIKKVVEAHDFPTLTIEGYEADDVIGTLTKQAVEAGLEVHIVSGDKDFAQLISADVRMLDTMKDVSYDPELVRKKWGVPPAKFVDYLALIGDKADNIPGVPGIGPKTAKALLERFGDLQTVLDSTDQLKGKQKERLEDHRDDALMSKDLATIDVDMPADVLGATLADLDIPPVEAEKVDALYRELEFFSLLSGNDAQTHASDGDFAALQADELTAYFEELGADGMPVAVVPVHQLPSQIHGDLIGVAFASAGDEGKVARYLPVRGDQGLGPDALDAFRAWAADSRRSKVTHDLRDVLTVLRRAEIPLTGVVGDTRLGSFLIDPTKDIPHRLDQVARSFLHRTLIPLKDVVGGGKAQKKLAEVELDSLAPYVCHLAAAVAEAWPKIAEGVESEGQTRYLQEISLPLARVLADMQLDGIGADPEVLVKLGEEFAERKASVEADVYKLAGREFNIGSPKQLGGVLFDELKLPVIKRTKTGYSTAADVLERLASKHDVAKKILEWRSLAKLINTYTRVLREAIHPRTSRIHCTFQQTVGASGRLITTEPDLQRTPIRTDDGKRIREAFVPREGWVMVSADWSQIELRILAHITEDELLLESFQKDIDVHRKTASQIFDVAPEEVTPAQRNVGKTVNFATIYGQGATALGQSLGMPRSEAKDIIDRYFEAYAGVSEWQTETVNDAYQHGWVQTLTGRKRYVPELSSNNVTDRAYGERIATNTPIQGSAADICKLAMLDISRRLQDAKHEGRMLLQIHDELVFEAPPSEREAIVELVRDAMENAFPELSVPLKVDVGWGASWAEAH
ncbi:MAG: DNA polymerase I [Myxococcota bacterium]